MASTIQEIFTLHFRRDRLIFWLTVEGLLVLGGLWRSALLANYYLNDATYRMARLDLLAPVATLVMLFYLLRTAKRMFFDKRAFCFDENGVTRIGFWGAKSFRWDQVDRIVLEQSFADLWSGQIERWELAIHLSQGRGVEHFSMADVEFDATLVKEALSNFTLAEVQKPDLEDRTA